MPPAISDQQWEKLLEKVEEISKSITSMDKKLEVFAATTISHRELCERRFCAVEESIQDLEQIIHGTPLKPGLVVHLDRIDVMMNWIKAVIVAVGGLVLKAAFDIIVKLRS